MLQRPINTAYQFAERYFEACEDRAYILTTK
jgi:hypothetical protein